MKLMKLEKYAKITFTEDSCPDIRTLRKWINKNKLPGKKIGSSYFVDIDADQKMRTMTGNSLADKVLQESY